MGSIWDDPEMQVNDDFVKFDAVGDTITGDILRVRAHRFDDNSVAPQILVNTVDGQFGGTPLDADVEKTITCGQIRLKAKLTELRPEAGDRIRIELTDIEKRSGGKELKHFEVEVTHGTGQPARPAAAPAASTPQVPAQAAAPAAAAPAPDPAVLAAAVAALSDEQKKALGLG